MSSDIGIPISVVRPWMQESASAHSILMCSGPPGRDTRQPGRQIARLQGQDLAAGKVWDIPCFDVPLEELAPFELGALLGRQVVEVYRERIPTPGNRWAISYLSYGRLLMAN
jgi:hypothetical protein